MIALKNIQSMPVVYENIHESVFRSYQILDYVILMISRGDSKETMLDIIDFLKDGENYSNRIINQHQ